jgi:hypothetical protein
LTASRSRKLVRLKPRVDTSKLLTPPIKMHGDANELTPDSFNLIRIEINNTVEKIAPSSHTSA